MTVMQAKSTQTRGVIVSVRVDEVTVPLPRPVRNGTALISDRDYVLVTVEDEDGRTGTACALSRRAPIRSVVEEFIAPRLIGRSVFEVQQLWQDNYEAGELFLGRSGAFARALSLVDIAVWDLHGTLSDASLSSQLGGAGTKTPLLMALGYYRFDDAGHRNDDLDLLVADYQSLLEQGFRRFKIMAGGAPRAVDVERVRAVMSVLPNDARLAIDVNGSWSTGKEALSFVDAVGVDFDFIEDPFRPENETAFRDFRRHSSVSIAMGEWESGRHRFRELIERDLLDVVRIDATACGGISEWLKIAALAVSFDKRIVPHYYPEIHLHLAAATPGTEAVEVVPSMTGADNFESLLLSPSWTESPLASPSSEPGLGIDWNWEFIRAHSS
jgi:D-arabinonate dehydratase